MSRSLDQFCAVEPAAKADGATSYAHDN